MATHCHYQLITPMPADPVLEKWAGMHAHEDETKLRNCLPWRAAHEFDAAELGGKGKICIGIKRLEMVFPQFSSCFDSNSYAAKLLLNSDRHLESIDGKEYVVESLFEGADKCFLVDHIEYNFISGERWCCLDISGHFSPVDSILSCSDSFKQGLADIANAINRTTILGPWYNAPGPDRKINVLYPKICKIEYVPIWDFADKVAGKYVADIDSYADEVVRRVQKIP